MALVNIYKQQLHIDHNSSNNVWHLITKTVTTLQHSATLHHTSSNYTSPNYASLPLIYTSLPFHLALRIYISYRSISLHITSHDTVQISSPKLFPK
jgi:hypothetical protein